MMKEQGPRSLQQGVQRNASRLRKRAQLFRELLRETRLRYSPAGLMAGGRRRDRRRRAEALQHFAKELFSLCQVLRAQPFNVVRIRFERGEPRPTLHPISKRR